MSTEDAGGFSSSPLTAAQSSINTGCPVCGTPIDGIVCDGPSSAARYTAEPCGHALGQLTISAIKGDL